jgi:hypothetical protein
VGRPIEIPRVFHRIWLGDRPLPAEFRDFGKTWERLHPGWRMRLWTAANLPPLANRWAFQRSRSYSGKANVLRYEILLRHGGVYLDTDFECLRNIEPLLGGVSCFAGYHRDQAFEHGSFAVVNNAILGAVPGHPFLRDLVAEAETNMRGIMEDNPIPAYQTGPIFLTAVVHRHPEVKLFPPGVFYPYGPRERWRRHERFPGAYAVHHWTLNGMSAIRRKSRRLGVRGTCLTVVLHPVVAGDALRLNWVLEGLCEQWVSDFEVILPGVAGRLARIAAGFRKRLRIRHLVIPRSGRRENRSAWLRNRALRAARSPRILFLDSDCLPDPDVIGNHAGYRTAPVLLTSFRRLYPAAKLFPFRDTVDYGSMLHHSLTARRRAHLVPARGRWRSVNAFCFSAPTRLLRAVGGFAESPAGDEVRDLARRLDEAGCPTVPTLTGATVTWLGPEGS